MILLTLPDIATEDRLLRRANRGDDVALRIVYEQYYVPVYQFIRLRVDDVQTAEDLSANVFFAYVKACRERKGPRKSLRGWLFRVARNELYDHFGENHRIRQDVLDDWLLTETDTEPGPELQMLRTERTEALHEAIQKLTVDQQEVIALRFGQMLSLEETADLMGKRTNAIKQLQLRAVNSLRRRLEQQVQEVPGES
jgi:RNA polymerase sigma-70 factor, ECF subfamily